LGRQQRADPWGRAARANVPETLTKGVWDVSSNYPTRRAPSLRQRPSFVLPRLIPQGEFYAVADSHFVVDRAQVVPDNMRSDPKPGGDFVVLEPSRDEFNDAPLPLAEHPCLVEEPLSKRQYRLLATCRADSAALRGAGA